MKSFYELKSEEIQKYKAEFLKLDFVKNRVSRIIPIVICFMIVVGLLTVAEFIFPDEGIEYINLIIIFGLIIITISMLFTNTIAFRQWLKTKHHIE